MLRYAMASEVPQIAALYHRVWHETHARFMPAEECARRDVAFFHDRMTTLQPTTLVATQDRDLTGFAAWHNDVLSQMFVAAQWRGSGLAQQLLTRAEHAMAHGGIDRANLHCIVGNSRARRFYERQGWMILQELAHPAAGQPDGVLFWRMVKCLAP